MASPAHIVGVGARTPVGLQATPAAAAVRAGILGLGEHPFMVDSVGDLMPGALDVEIDPRIMGPRRFLLLAESALRESCEPLGAGRRLPFDVPLYLGLPEMRPGFTEEDATEIRSGMSRIEGLPARLSKVTTFTEGHAAGLSALAAAVEELKRGTFEVCLVGGVESYFHPDTMEWLDGNRQLANTVSRSGFVPGEGAGFCLLMTEPARVRLGLKSLARVIAVAVGKETKLIKTTDICLGEGLSATVGSVLSGFRPPDERINGIFCDINGERYRNEEWGFVCLRLSHYFDDPTGYQSPADSWGDIGAASGPLFAVLACEGLARGHAPGPRILLWTSSERGRRSAAVIESPQLGPKGVG
jgi:3-oxoacyl-[acyl-carrier-protein] synthase I